MNSGYGGAVDPVETADQAAVDLMLIGDEVEMIAVRQEMADTVIVETDGDERFGPLVEQVGAVVGRSGEQTAVVNGERGKTEVTRAAPNAFVEELPLACAGVVPAEVGARGVQRAV